MRISHWGLPVVCAPVLLAAGGCYSNPYSPYGYGGYGGTYSSPPAGIVQPYAPQGGYPQGGFQQPGFQSNPPSQYPTEVQPGGDSWQQPSGGTQGFPSDAPTFDSNRDDYAPPPDGNLVPLPNDSPTPSFNNNPEPFNANPEPFNSNQPYESNQPFNSNQPPYQSSPGNDSFDSNGAIPFGTDGVQNTPSQRSFQSVEQVQQASHQSEVFQPPVHAEKVVTRHLAATTARAETEPSPFSYDRKGFRWLRGVVDFDAKDQTWNIIYSINPESSDRFGGSITLVDDALLRGLKDDDRVLVQGRVDENSRDRFGKPQYRVEHLGRIVPE